MNEPRMAKVDAMSVTTHLLLGRKSACGYPPGEPPRWPAGHVWCRVERGHLLSCPKCQRILKEVHAERRA